MELQFEKKTCPCLRHVVREVQNQEQTQELKLPDGMPDIGSVLGAWGQCVLRGKEWRSDTVGVTGGVMAWVMYAPADGSEPRTVEVWLPLQMKWSFPETKREGTIRTDMCLRGVDARTLSARKLMVRANVGVLTEAMEPWEAELSVPQGLPTDVQLLRRTYPARLPRESGEKTFLMDETLPLPPGSVPAEKIIAYRLLPSVNEEKVVGGKAVFRGEGNFHMLYQGTDGQLYSTDLEIPYSQFSDLDRDYDKEAELSVMMALSGLEPELSEGGLRIKCSMVAQYLVHDICMVEVVEDAYSPLRPLTLQQEELRLPMVLDRSERTMRYEAAIPAAATRVADTAVLAEQPTVRRAGELTELEVNGTAQVLYYDEEGKLRCDMAHWSDTWEHPVGQNAAVMASVENIARPQFAVSGDQIVVRGELETCAQITAAQGIPMVTGLILGDTAARDPERPSLILRRAGEGTLWDIAKESGSTVEAIRKANRLTDEPLDDRLLLIPVS